MKLKMFTVFDTKVGAYMQPFYARSTNDAIRSFTQAANDSSHQFGKWAEDFCLFEIGAFDDQTCGFELKDTPVSLGKAIEFIRRDSDPAQLKMVQ